MTDTTDIRQGTRGKRRKAPNGEGMRLHGFRCDDPTWNPAQARAVTDGIELSTMFRDILEAYGSGEQSFTFPTGDGKRQV